VLRSKHPDGVYQEVYGYLCTHYAIRRLMHDAALQADLDPDRLSFTRSLRAARRSTRSHPGFLWNVKRSEHRDWPQPTKPPHDAITILAA